MGDGSFFISAMGVVPKKGLSKTVRKLTKVRSSFAVRRFAARYGINLDEAEKPIEEYPTILDLFTRRLKPGVRPIDGTPTTLISPVDGTFDAAGRISSDGQLLQAKGRAYSLAALLGDEQRAARYVGGGYATLYLSPKDYHRIHSPVTGHVTGATYVPGELWPVNPAAVAHVDALFARNERVITHLTSETFGAMELVMVGATNVGHMTVAYDDDLATNTGATQVDRRKYDPPRAIERGGDLGVFEMGSTVVLIVEEKVLFDDLALKTPIQMGKKIGRVGG